MIVRYDLLLVHDASVLNQVYLTCAPMVYIRLHPQGSYSCQVRDKIECQWPDGYTW
jgi:hypothetical protein